MADGYQTREEAEQRIEELRSEVERLRAERARAVEALGSIGRTAVAATGDLEDGINAELIARERADGDIPDLLAEAWRERDAARAEVKRLRKELTEASEVLTVTGEKLTAVRGQRDRAEAERDRLAEQAERVRARHTGVCSGACGLDDACECEERDLACDECSASWPCATIRALDGTEAGQ